MTEAELIQRVPAIAGTSIKDTENVLDGFRHLVQATVLSGDTISYRGLGKFSRSSRRELKVLNPQTGMPMDLPAMQVAHCSASASFKRVVRASEDGSELGRVA
ncbi:MAG TPA: HU family DNA-binding protein [Dehalococcoidia bacterium]|nr:HU family DNA-binding protein [Dehalococcoidia bacterium]